MFNLAIKEIIQETSTVKTFVFDKPSDFSFKPGQFCWISLPEHPSLGRSPMAIASGTKESELRFSIREWGELTSKLFEYQRGDLVTISRPEGTAFPLDISEGKIIHGIAGGTGITPIRSIYHSLDGEKTKMKIFYGVKTPADFLYEEDLSKWEAILIVETPHPHWKGHVGKITDLLRKEHVEVANGICYVCGPTPMMKSVVKILREMGFSPDQIYVSLERMENGKVIGPVYPVSNPIVGF